MTAPNERRALLVRKFRELGRERMVALRAAWAAVAEKPEDADAAASLTQLLHLLKGDAKLVGLVEPARLLRQLEELVAQTRAALERAQAEARRRLIDETLRSLDRWVTESGDAPVLAELGAKLEARLQALASMQGTAGAPGRARVLVVDDSYLVRTGLTAMLGALGYEVTVAQDGLDALSALERSKPDAILTDVEMPRLGGRELLQRIRGDERWKALPVVVVSHSVSPDELKDVMDEGADAYIGKGEIDEQRLARELERLLPASPA